MRLVEALAEGTTQTATGAASDACLTQPATSGLKGGHTAKDWVSCWPKVTKGLRDTRMVRVKGTKLTRALFGPYRALCVFTGECSRAA